MVSAEDGRPVPGATVALRPLAGGPTVNLAADERGIFFRRGLRPGPYALRCQADGYLPQEDRIVLQAERVNEVEVALVPAGRVVITSETLREALERFRSNDWKGAIGAARAALAEQPDDHTALFILARSHLEIGEAEEAVEAYEKLLSLDPDNVDALLDVGSAYVQLQEGEPAADAFRKVLALDPRQADALYNLGTLLFRQGEVDEAIERLETAVEVDPNRSLAHLSLGYALLRKEDFEGARRHLRRYLELRPDAPDRGEIEALLDALPGDQPGAGPG